MYENLLIINKKHKKAAKTILEKVMAEKTDKYIITISGEVGAGKASIAHVLGKKLKKRGIKVKTIYLDNYYIVPPAERTEWRRKHGLESVGPQEIDWELLKKNISDFLTGSKSAMPLVDLMNDQVDELITDFKNIEILIISGLYAMEVEEADLKVFIELTYRETLDVQKEQENEELDEFRMQVLEAEHKAVQALKHKADFFVDFDTSLEIFHL